MITVQARYPKGYVPYSNDGNGEHRKINPEKWYDQDTQYKYKREAKAIVKWVNGLGLETMKARIKPEQEIK